MLSCSLIEMLGPKDGVEEELSKTEATSYKEVWFLDNGDDSSISAIHKLQDKRTKERE